MGQAKKRGSYEERVAQAISAMEAQILEGERLFEDQWRACRSLLSKEDLEVCDRKLGDVSGIPEEVRRVKIMCMVYQQAKERRHGNDIVYQPEVP